MTRQAIQLGTHGSAHAACSRRRSFVERGYRFRPADARERHGSGGADGIRPPRRPPLAVGRPWGAYTVLQEAPGFKIKRIEVKPGASLSLQLHHRRSEHWVVVSGTARCTRDDDVYTVGANESTYIPSNTRHRLANPGNEPLVIIEVQCGDYVGEDDIVRFDDVYGRVKT